MTDRELLELAAKAAGIVGEWSDTYGSITVDDVRVLGFHLWNPLTDDGDALRLAVSIGLVVCVMREIELTGIYLPADHIGGKYDVTERHDSDPYAATRRAIVRAAAEIGRVMSSP